MGTIRALDDLVEPGVGQDPLSPLRWTLKSSRSLAEDLTAMGHEVSHVTVDALLTRMGYSMRTPAETMMGAPHPDDNAQFRHINARAKEFLNADQPVISVGCRQLVGDFAHPGSAWRPEARPDNAAPQIDPDQHGLSAESGGADAGPDGDWMSVGIDDDTASLAVDAIHRWWQIMGAERYRGAKRLLVAAHAGGCNGRLWQVELARLAPELDLDITVCGLPRGSSKWNTAEHRLLNFTTVCSLGRDPAYYRTLVELSGSATTRTSLKVRVEWSQGPCPGRAQVTDAEMTNLPLKADVWHGERNHTLASRPARAVQSAADALGPERYCHARL